MPESSLNPHRYRIDHIDKAILDLLKERNEVVKEVLITKIAHKLPIFVAGREERKIQSFREEAVRRNLDADWAEDFLRMIMSASRASQSTAEFPMSTLLPKTIVFVGGGGGMGTLFASYARSSGHVVRILDRDDWSQVDTLCSGADAVVITVPIHDTIPVIRRIAPHLPPSALLADFTSNKSDVLDAMMEAHPGPVVGLHPMHGPDVHNLSKQLMMVCPGRDADAGQWLLNQFQLWGMRLVTADPTAHDRAMHVIQGLRHFIALLHGSYLKNNDLKPSDILNFSSPIYRAELMMTGRIFAQDAALYADIVFSNEERRAMLMDFLDHHSKLADMVRAGDREAFIAEFQAITAFFGDFAETALNESGYLIHRLADRFA